MNDTPESNVTLLPNGMLPDDNAPHAIVSTLEDFLAEARAGKLAGVAIAVVYTNDEKADTATNYASADGLKPSRLLGAVTRLQSRLTSWIAGDLDA